MQSSISCNLKTNLQLALTNLTQRLWYENKHPFLLYLLWPWSCLFKLVIFLRQKAYAYGFFKSVKLPVPVIIVGNITIGGVGKTPIVIALCQFLQQQGMKPGVITCGYGKKASLQTRIINPEVKGFLQDGTLPDEAKLCAWRAHVKVAVNQNKAQAAQDLLIHGCDVIIADDGLQHYRLKRDIELLVIDGQRHFGNQHVMPMGPLREPISRIAKVDAILVNSSSLIETHAKPQFNIAMVPNLITQVADLDHHENLNYLKNVQMILMSGIGNPVRFRNTVESLGYQIKAHISFNDHHDYHAIDFSSLQRDTILMTEKDAVKCSALVNQNTWALRINANLDENFKQYILNKLQSIEK